MTRPNQAILYLDEVIEQSFFTGFSPDDLAANLEAFAKKVNDFLPDYEEARRDWLVDTHDGVLEDFYKKQQQTINRLVSDSSDLFNLLIAAGNSIFSSLLGKHEKTVLLYESTCKQLLESLRVIQRDISQTGPLGTSIDSNSFQMRNTVGNIRYLINSTYALDG
ncbi:hypothetical protein HYU18_04110 [Candidatus Woesearchaeota archaeon]|nr:hypothetical protein [Candidatus Woesearchaeota archaeon]